MSNIEISLLSDTQIEHHLDDIARLRINIFKEYPYLYEGNLEYEAQYLKKFIQTPESLIVVLKDNGHIVGAITGLPLQYEDAEIIQPWSAHNHPIDKVYYFSELLIYPEYRGKGLGQKIFDLAEKTVADLHKYDTFALITVIRPDSHPSKPSNYRGLEAFWSNNGYVKDPELICHISWKEIGEEQESDKPLIFWIKNSL